MLGAGTMDEDRKDLIAAHEALRQASEALLRAQEDERQRVGQWLHDSTSWRLADLAAGLATLRRSATGAATRALLDEMEATLQEAVRETQALAYLARPAVLAREGLEAAVRGFIVGFSARSGLDVRLAVRGDLSAAAEPVQHAVFRVVQEALANVYRHAGASMADVELAAEAGQLTATIADDGKGFPGQVADAEGAPLGVGVPGMRMRMEQLGGRLLISSGGSGVQVTAVVPLDRGV
jgi:two-component system NarL family sensor kinase